MHQRFLPFARRIFDLLPDVHSVVYAVGQYWNDEAADAVHEIMAPSLDRDPKWPEILRPPLYECEGFAWLADDVDARIPTPSGPGLFRLGSEFPGLDDNGSMITAFAGFCPEGCDQEMPDGESHVPYAIARRGAGGAVDLQIVGVLSRPEWEDRFDVGTDEVTGEALPGPTARADQHDAPAPHRPDVSARRGLLGLFRRLFGRGG